MPSSDDYRQIVTEYGQHDFPLDNMVMDMDWHKDGWTGWSWNRKLLPDAEALLPWFHSQGLHVTLNLHPADGVAPHEDRYAAFMQGIGADPAAKQTIPFDAGSKTYMDALFGTVFAPLEKDGVDFWWLDWQQYPNTRAVPDLTNLFWLNTLLYDRTAQNGQRGLSFSRWAGWGDHRHPIHFSGDANTGFPMLAFEVPFTSTAGNVGCFFWSHDIGGHMGGRNEESYARWCQFGATSPVLRSHSTRDVQTQAVFALKGKPLNTYGLTKKVIYENEEFHLLQSALNIEDGLDGLRYNKIIIATDADVDGMHIRLLLLSFFLQFFPDVIRNNHLFILDTPLFRVRNKKKTMYCYSEQEKQLAVAELGSTHEITRFKGLGEISASEFKDFIGENIRLEPVNLHHLASSDELLAFFMGKNTPERQDFIIDNLRVEKDLIEA